MTAGVDFQRNQDQVETTWREIQRMEREGAQGWQRRSTQTTEDRYGMQSQRIQIHFANGCRVELSRTYQDGRREAYHDVVMQIVLPAREERVDIPPSDANAANRRLLGVPPSRDGLFLAGAPVMIRDRQDFDRMFGSRPSPARRSGDEARAQMGRADPPAPVLKRYPNEVELNDIQAAMTALLSGRGTEVREDPGMPVWLCRHQFTTDGTEGGYRAGPEAFKILYRLQASVIEADRALQAADQRAADTPFDGGRVRRRLLDT
jgi:hypothetical protein